MNENCVKDEITALSLSLVVFSSRELFWKRKKNGIRKSGEQVERDPKSCPAAGP